MSDHDRIQAYITKTGNRDPELIRASMKRTGPPLPMAVIRAYLGHSSSVPPPPRMDSPLSVKGISLVNIRVSHKKPNEGLKAKIYALRKGQGYPVAELAKEWCLSADTIKANATRLDCHRYVELSPGEWVSCVLHPETAATIKSK